LYLRVPFNKKDWSPIFACRALGKKGYEKLQKVRHERRLSGVELSNPGWQKWIPDTREERIGILELGTEYRNPGLQD
jgi:hypothetical protein